MRTILCVLVTTVILAVCATESCPDSAIVTDLRAQLQQAESRAAEHLELLRRAETAIKGTTSQPARQRVFLAVGILSAPYERSVRDACRETWLQLARDESVAYHFIVGNATSDGPFPSSLQSSLLEEQARFGDLAFVPALDGYKHLTKKVYAYVQWVTARVEFDFFMKTDSDSFVALDRILDALEQEPQRLPRQRLYWGRMHFSHVHKDPNEKYWGRWFEEHHADFYDHSPPYAYGLGYVLSGDLVRWLAASSVPFRMYSNEDLAVGTWLQGLEVTRVDNGAGTRFIPFFSEGPQHALRVCSALCADFRRLEAAAESAASAESAALLAAEAKLFAVCNPLDETGLHRLFRDCYGL